MAEFEAQEARSKHNAYDNVAKMLTNKPNSTHGHRSQTGGNAAWADIKAASNDRQKVNSVYGGSKNSKSAKEQLQDNFHKSDNGFYSKKPLGLNKAERANDDDLEARPYQKK